MYAACDEFSIPVESYPEKLSFCEYAMRTKNVKIFNLDPKEAATYSLDALPFLKMMHLNDLKCNY